MRQCADEGMTVIISSSESEELLSISDRVYVFYEGCVSALLDGDTKTPEALVAALLGLTGEQGAARPVKEVQYCYSLLSARSCGFGGRLPSRASSFSSLRWR